MAKNYADPEESLFQSYLDTKSSKATTQETLDNLAIASMFAPVVGDVTGLAADAYRLTNNPEERTPLNYGMMGLGLLPFVPNMSTARQAAEKVGIRQALNLPVQNMPNKLPGFYSGDPVSKGYASGKAILKGIESAAEQFLTPYGLSLADENIPLKLKDVVVDAYKEVDDIKAYGEKLKVDVGVSDLPDTEKIRLMDEIDAKTTRLVREVSNKVEGQKQHSYMSNVQFGSKQNPIVEAGTNRVNLATGDYTKQTFKDFFPDVPEEMFDMMTSNQKMKAGEGKLVLRNAFGGAAGNLRNDAVGNNGSKVAKAAWDLFGGQAVASSFKSGTGFLNKLQEINLTAAQKSKVNDTEFQASLNAAFRKNPSLKEAKTAEDFYEVLKKSGVKINKGLVEKAFHSTARKPFKNTDELIAGLEAKGLKISDAEKTKAAKRGYVLLTDSMVSSAIDLGGVNLVHAIYPNGRKETLINDGYNLFGMIPPGADKLVNATHYTEDLLGGKNPSKDGPLKNTGPVRRPEKEVPFPSQTIQQQVSSEELFNLNPAITDAHRARAFRNQLLVGGAAGGAGYAAFGDEEE